MLANYIQGIIYLHNIPTAFHYANDMINFIENSFLNKHLIFIIEYAHDLIKN